MCFCKLTLRLYTHQPKHEVKWGTLVAAVGNLWVLAIMWMLLDTIDWNTAADTSTSYKLLRIDQRKKTKSSRRRPGLQIPQILIWLSCAGKESDQWRPHHGSDSALTCRGSSCSVWHRDAGTDPPSPVDRVAGRLWIWLVLGCRMNARWEKRIWEIWRAGRHRELFVTIPAVSLGTEGCALYFKPCSGGWCTSNGVQMKTRTRGFSAEHCTVTRWSMLFTFSVSGFNLVADQCVKKNKSKWLYQTFVILK